MMRRFLFIKGILLLLAIALNGCSSQSTPLSVLAGSELKDLKALLPEVDRCAGTQLDFTYIGTLDGAESLANGTHHDIAWFSHGKYLSMLDLTRSRILTQEKIMLSPVVLGVKQSKARAWGWEGKRDLTWRDIAQKAAEGELRYAMTNPAASNSGFTALVGVASALSGNTSEFNPNQLDHDGMKAFFKGQALTAGSSGWLAEAYIREQDRLEGIINYESVLIQLNRNGALREPLTLIYPKEGIITADYPIMLLNKEKREVFDKLVVCLRSADIQRRLMEETQRRPVVPQVKPDSRFKSGLLVELPFPRNAQTVDALLFTYLDEVRKPSHTVFVLDVSGSMRGQRMVKLKEALANLTGVDRSLTGQFARFRARETVVMLPFSGRAHRPTVFKVRSAQADSDDMRALRDYIQSLELGGGTAIYDALAEAYRLTEADMRHDPERFYTIVLLTDGANTDGMDFNTFEHKFWQYEGKASQVKTFPILFGNSKEEEMRALGELTGGRTFDAHKHSLRHVFKKIRGYQ
jgi:Ca-activated chloride channel family protein